MKREQAYLHKLILGEYTLGNVLTNTTNAPDAGCKRGDIFVLY